MYLLFAAPYFGFVAAVFATIVAIELLNIMLYFSTRPWHLVDVVWLAAPIFFRPTFSSTIRCIAGPEGLARRRSEEPRRERARPQRRER